MKIRDFRYLWIGRLISTLGSWLLVVAIPAHVYQLTGSVAATGLTLAAEYLPPLLLGLVAGALIDRWDRRRVMIASDVFRAVAVAAMLFATTESALWLVYVALVAESTGTVLFRPAAQAMTPAVVGKGSALGSANSLNAITDGTVRLVGPPVGAALLSVSGFTTLIVVDVLSYVVSALAVWATAHRFAAGGEERTTVAGVLADLGEGLRYLRAHRIPFLLLPLTTVFLLANAALSAVLVPFGVQRFGGSTQVGVVVSALGIGFLLGAAAIRPLIDRVQPRYLLAAAQTAVALCFFWLFATTSLTAAVPAAVCIGVFGSMTIVTPQTALQRVVPDEVLGRVVSAFFVAEALATLVGSLAGPALAEALSPSAVAFAACVLTAAGALVGLVVLPVARELVPVPGGK